MKNQYASDGTQVDLMDVEVNTSVGGKVEIFFLEIWHLISRYILSRVSIVRRYRLVCLFPDMSECYAMLKVHWGENVLDTLYLEVVIVWFDFFYSGLANEIGALIPQWTVYNEFFLSIKSIWIRVFFNIYPLGQLISILSSFLLEMI